MRGFLRAAYLRQVFLKLRRKGRRSFHFWMTETGQSSGHFYDRGFARHAGRMKEGD
jgi:hypothetical protein